MRPSREKKGKSLLRGKTKATTAAAVTRKTILSRGWANPRESHPDRIIQLYLRGIRNGADRCARAPEIKINGCVYTGDKPKLAACGFSRVGSAVNFLFVCRWGRGGGGGGGGGGGLSGSQFGRLF